MSSSQFLADRPGLRAGLEWIVALTGAILPAVASGAPSSQVVYIGDSHSLGIVGEVVAQGLRSRPQIDYEFAASGGSAPLQWINHRFTTPCGYVDSSGLPASPPRQCVSQFLTPTFDSLLKVAQSRAPGLSFNHKLAVIVLGTNFSPKPEDHEFQVRAAATLMIQAHQSGYQCLWFGAPNMLRFRGELIDQSYAVVEEAKDRVKSEIGSEGCTIVDSRRLSHYPTQWASTSKPDGIHYDYPAPWYHFPEGRAAGTAWGNAILERVLQIIGESLPD